MQPRRSVAPVLTPLALAIGLAAGPASASSSGYALLLNDNQIAFAVDGRATQPSSARPVQGVQPGDWLVTIDVRPQNGRLYALGHNPVLGSLRLYHVDIAGPALRAMAVGESGTLSDASGLPINIQASGFDIDFNPTVDRLRVVSSSGLNARMNPNNGAFIDGDFGNPGSPSPGTNPDGPLNIAGMPADAMGTAYANNRINTGITTQYSLSHSADRLYIQNPPNSGTLTMALPITVDGSPIDFGSSGGLDIEPGIDAPSANAPAPGRAVAALSVGGQSRLYRIDLQTGAATDQGPLGGLNVLDIAVLALPATAKVLNLAGDRLGRLPLGNPALTTYATVSGVVAGERLVGIDLRPATGQLYALGIDAANDRGTLYLLEPQSAGGTAAATPVGAPGRIAYVDGNGVPVDLSDLPAGFDFNPTVDRIRFMDASGLNARINPNDGSPVDGDSGSAGVNPDGSVQAELGTQIAGTAYTGSVPMAPFTTQYTLDQAFARLSIQNPPNAGVQTMQMALTRNGQPFEFGGETGFDIPAGVTAPAANQPAAGQGFFTAADGNGAPALFAISLSDASVDLIGAFNAPQGGQTGLSVSDSAPAVAASPTVLAVGRGDPARTNALLLSGNAVPVSLRTLPGTALPGIDYVDTRRSVLLNGANGIDGIEVPTLAGATPGRQFTVELSGPFASPLLVTVTINGDGNQLFSNGFEAD
jgi:hypothetical protein